MPSPIDKGITAEDLGRTLFIGVGGVGMSGLTRLWATRGLATVGSEYKDWPSLPELVAQGVVLHRQHEASNLDGIDTVVRSTAINDEHIEVAEARRRGIPVLHRSEALAAAMTGRTSIVVTGTHGKTSTTAILTQILEHSGRAPSYVNGGEIIGAHSGAHGTGDHFVAEADESDRSFLRYRPTVGIVTNIDADHLNVYGDMDSLCRGFETFCRNVEKRGFTVLCQDNEGTASLAERLQLEGRDVVTYGRGTDATLRVGDFVSSTAGVDFTAWWKGEELGRFRLPVPGEHLALNSAAAIAVCHRLGLTVEEIAAGMASFGGVKRRFELRGVRQGVRYYDEYAYHPTAMTEALKTLRNLTEGRVIAVFLPYRVYRTIEMRSEIAAALGLADKVVVMEIFGPGETIPPGEGGAALTEALPQADEDKVFVERWEDVPEVVDGFAREGDIVVTMGAPPISLMPDDLLAR
ncbi:UDP-N-acetylmuramate--L-alanine ligase [Natronoglycomyces albus]|uniref:UDP-N-acetylmuramate--L-alanine ligase n=1 Tax=Natronoglycomyces albus TaxID=2811108 RepID=A0A895XTQ9_9ACTN|nr:UDP-N-acetylmuramate--L-alanine ligase [Natronoglycomyces albus]